MKFSTPFEIRMIAPCGINCHVCAGHLRKKKPCSGCKVVNAQNQVHRENCAIRLCCQSKGFSVCSSCTEFPCRRIKSLNKRYMLNYKHDLVATGLRLKEAGADQFLREEESKWTCLECGGLICLHDKTCSECGEVFN